jgi:hypothetical protein
MALANMADNAAEVFVYAGEGAVVPNDVVRVRIDPSVLAIPSRAFEDKYKLQVVQLHDGLREIGRVAFDNCRALQEVQSSNGVERIGHSAFHRCQFTKFRSPPLVTRIPGDMLMYCERLFSLEVSQIIIEVKGFAFSNCHSLRNVALTSNIVVAHNAFINCQDLIHIFGTQHAIVDALRNRFDGLPVHSKIYYISYYCSQMTAVEILKSINIDENGVLDCPVS